MPSTRREFLGAAATVPAWSLPVGHTRLTHRWTYRSPELVLPPRLGEDVLVTARRSGLPNADRPSAIGLDTETGSLAWSHPGRVEWRPETVGDRFLVTSGEAVAAVATATGRTEWTVSFSEELEDVLEAVTGDPENGMAYARIATGVVGLDRETGDRLWETGGVQTRYVGSAGGTAVLTTRETVRGVDPRTGRVRWDRDVARFPHSLHLGRFLVPDLDDGALVAWDAETGERAWTYAFGDGHARILGSNDAHVFIRLHRSSYSGEDEEVVVAVTRDGREAWRTSVSADTGTILTEDAVVVLGVPDGPEREFTVLDPATGRVQWRDGVGFGFGLLTSSNGVLRIPTDEAVIARSVTNGVERWRYEPDGTPVYAVERGGRVYVGTRIDTESVGAAEKRERPETMFALHAVDPPSGPLVAAERWIRQQGVLAVALAGLGLLGGGAVAANRWKRAKRVQGHVETVERTDAWTTAHVQNGTVRTEFRNVASDVEDGFVTACETWQARNDEAGVLALQSWGTDPRPWVETAGYETTLADTVDRDRGLRAVSTAADVLARNDRPHGTLRPASVVFDADGEAFVRDVGLGAFTHDAFPDRTDAFTPPEGGEPSAAGDVYRLGALAVRVLTGGPPGDESLATDREFETAVSDDLRDVLTTAVAESPDDRYDSVRRFGEYFAWAAFAQPATHRRQ